MVGHNEAPVGILKAEEIFITNGGLKLLDAFTLNGTNNVTISNVAPSGVGTATITAWLQLQSNTGTAYYIPLWT